MVLNPVLSVASTQQEAGQGNEPDGKGYNPPGLLGMAVAAQYLHAGNARKLDELLSPLFVEQTTALTQNVNFLLQAGDVDNLVAFVLSIDETTTTLSVPAVGDEGGDFCDYP